MKTPDDICRMVPTIKVVSAGCNMRCHYCYYRKCDQGKIRIMSDDVLRAVITKTVDFSESEPVVIIWHGGEPLLAGLEFYEKAVAIEREVAHKKKVENHIQTNGTLVSKKWADFFSQNDFRVGISIDGPPVVHNHNRVFRNGRGSYNATVRGLRYLQAAGLQPGVISLVSQISLGKEKEILQSMLDLGIKRILPKPCYEIDKKSGTLANYSVNPQSFTDFMVNLMNIWLEKDDPEISIRNLEQIILGLVGGSPSLCEFSGRCWLFPCVEFNGQVSACDSFPVRQYPYGNILHQTWEELFSSSGFKNFLSDIDQSRTGCKNCQWKRSCQGGCLRYSYSAETDQWHKNVFCQSKIQLFQIISDTIRKIETG